MATAPLTHAPRRAKCRSFEPTESEWARLLDFRVRVNDRPAYERAQRNVFRRGIYHFESRCADPRIIDFGCGIGVSILYFKHVYPAARIVACEPDPDTRSCLLETLSRNGLTDVAVIEPDSVQGTDGATASSRHLADCLNEPVEFLKLALNGPAWDVLSACGDRLRCARTMAIEYHHRPNAPRTLHRILERLDELGFDYLIATPESGDNADLKPPFWLTPSTRYDLLIHAARRDADSSA